MYAIKLKLGQRCVCSKNGNQAGIQHVVISLGALPGIIVLVLSVVATESQPAHTQRCIHAFVTE
jgi:hypothetical protein